MKQDLTGKIAVVSGANSGIGYAVAKGLLQRNAQVILLCRNEQRAQIALERIIRETNKNSVEYMLCDFSSLQSIQVFYNRFNNKYQQLDFICNCAGHTTFERITNSDGIELNFATNVLGPYFLNILLSQLMNSGQIINIAGEFHRFFKLDFENLYYTKHFSALRAGSTSMLERIMLTYTLAKDLKDRGILVNCFHPGNVDTEMTSKMPTVMKALTKMIKPFQLTPDEGADTCLWLIDQNQSETGKYFIKRKIIKSSDASYILEDQTKLKEICESYFRK